MSTEPVPPWLKKVGIVLLILWAVIFLLGAIGELSGFDFLQIDFKRIFLH